MQIFQVGDKVQLSNILLNEIEFPFLMDKVVTVSEVGTPDYNSNYGIRIEYDGVSYPDNVYNFVHASRFDKFNYVEGNSSEEIKSLTTDGMLLLTVNYINNHLEILEKILLKITSETDGFSVPTSLVNSMNELNVLSDRMQKEIDYTLLPPIYTVEDAPVELEKLSLAEALEKMCRGYKIMTTSDNLTPPVPYWISGDSVVYGKEDNHSCKATEFLKLFNLTKWTWGLYRQSVFGKLVVWDCVEVRHNIRQQVSYGIVKEITESKFYLTGGFPYGFSRRNGIDEDCAWFAVRKVPAEEIKISITMDGDKND